MEIHKKTWPESFEEILKGKKNFDIRLADFGIQEGDVLVLDEYDPTKKEYTGRKIKKKVSFVMKWDIAKVHSQEEIEKHGLWGVGLENETDLKEMQKEAYSIIEKWNEKNKRKHNKETVFPHLIEEVGEFAKEYGHFVSDWRQKPDKEKLSEELIDVLTQIFIFAEDSDIDLEDTFKKKINKLKERFGLE